MSTVYIKNESMNHIRLKNDTGADLVQYEFTIIGGVACVSDEAIVSGEVGSFHVENGILLQIADFVVSEDTFGTENASVYWDPVSGDFSDTATSGYYKVGIVQTVKNSDGTVVMSKFRDNTVLLGDSVVQPGEIGWISYSVAADATTALSNDFGFNFNILDAFVISDASNVSATIQLVDSADAAISDAMIAAVATTIVHAGIIDGVTNNYNEIADGIVKFLANGAADRGTIWMLVEGA